MTGTATASDITPGMSASTTPTTAARDLDDDAIQAIINMAPTSILQSPSPPHPTHGHIIAIHTGGFLFPLPSPGAISAHWPVVQESPAHHLAHLHFDRIDAPIHKLTHTQPKTDTLCWVYLEDSQCMVRTPCWTLRATTLTSLQTGKDTPTYKNSIVHLELMYITAPKPSETNQQLSDTSSRLYHA
jgi:hypothetical protein